MKAAVLTKPQTLEIKEVDVLPVGPKDILLKVDCCGICGSDIPSYMEPYVPNQIMGHEFVGRVAQVGAEVTDITEGMRGTGFSIGYCGECYWCKSGKASKCPELFYNYSGFGRPGGFAEYLHIKDAKLNENFFLISEDIPNDVATMVEPLGTGAFMTIRTKLKPGSNVVISGAGTIGNLAVRAAKQMNPATLIVTDVVDSKLDVALQGGATHVINSAKQDVLAEVQRILGVGKYSYGVGGMADLVVEASGNGKAAAQAYDLVRTAGTVCHLGIPHGLIPIEAGLIVYKDIRVMGFGASLIPKAIEWVEQASVDTAPLITHRFPLSEIQKGFETQINDKEAIKIVVDID